MTTDPPESEGRARATVRVPTGDVPAAVVAAALRPDDTEEMTTRAEDGDVVATVARSTTGGLRSTLDDHAVNRQTATAAAQLAKRHTTPDS